VATGTYRPERRSHPDPDSADSGSEFSESESEILAFKYEFIKNLGFFWKKIWIRIGSSALDADPEPRIR
jgi:hypothetical protein